MTGASSGIGRAVALELAAAGCDLCIHFAHNREGAESVAADVRGMGREARVLQADLRETPAEAVLEKAAAGGEVPSLWTLNAGADLLTTGLRHADYATKLGVLWEVDVRGGLLLAKAVCERLRGSGGSIVTIGWDQAERGMGGDSGELFAAAKNAVMGASRSLAVSYAPRVRVNCVAPGWIRTAWGETAPPEWQDRVLRETPLGRWGEPEDIARLVRFLHSGEAAYITGQVIYANGGAER